MKHIKQIALALLLALTSQTVGAQIHESRSFIKKTTITKVKKVDNNPWKKCQWFGRAGVLIPVGVSEYDEIISPKAGFDLDFGFKLRIGRHGWYWGMDLAMITRGMKRNECYYRDRYFSYDDYTYHYDDSNIETIREESISKVSGRLGLTTFGWRARFTNLLLDVNAGVALAYTPELRFKNREAARIHQDVPALVEFPIGIGLAYKHFTIDFSLLYSLYSDYYFNYDYFDKFDNHHSGYENLKYNNLRISVGYLF